MSHLSSAEFEAYRSRLGSALLCGRIRYSSERELQDVMQLRLKTVADDIEREFQLSRRDRPDFFWASTGIVIEAKVDRSDSRIFRQIVRYAEDERVKAVILFRHRPVNVPDTVNGKPVGNIEFWRMML